MEEIEKKIEELENDSLEDGTLLALVGVGQVQFIGLVNEGDVDNMMSNRPFEIHAAGIVIVQRGFREVSPGAAHMIKQAFVASMSMGGGPQSVTVTRMDFFQMPANDLCQSDYASVLEEYKRFIDTSDTKKEMPDAPRIIDPNVAAAMAQSLIRRGMPKP